MKSVRYGLMLLALLAAMVSTAAAGGIRPGAFTLSGLLGGYGYGGEQDLEGGPVVGVRGGYNFTKYFGAEALFDYTKAESTEDDVADAHTFRYGGDLLLHLWPDNNLVPYLAAGYGALSLDLDHENVTKGIFDYGVGVKYFFTDDLALRGDARQLIFRDDDTLFNYEFTVGLAYQFGGKKPAPAAAPVAGPVMSPPPVGEAPLESIPAAEPTPEKMKYCIALNIEFDIDRAEVRLQYREEVAKVGDFMNKYPDTTAVIEGYTDEVGSDEYNMQLSERRAESVVNYLVDNFGIERTRLAAKGYGKTKPVADNSTEEGKQKNRRINAVIDCAFDVMGLAPPPEKLCVTLKVEFAKESAEIQPRYYDAIDRIGDYLQKYPTTTAVIEGHTDNIGAPDYNLQLSQRRAESVVNYLVDKFKIDRTRLTAKGYGATRRIAYNTTAEGRQLNRRINAIIDCVVKQ